MSKSFTIDHPAELLAFLLASQPDVKKTKIRQWLKHGAVQINGQPSTRFNHPLAPGDVVTIQASGGNQAERLLPRGMQVVFEDASLIVIDKPVNLLSIATDGQREKTAHAYLMKYVTGGKHQSRERVFIVHRLDRETSGLMVFARTESAKTALQTQWSQAEKRYLAVVEGRPSANEGSLSSHLDETGPYKVHATAQGPETRLAVTHYKVLKQTKAHSLLELTLETGRRNQIRVHLAEAGCPIIGDRKYGAVTNPAKRLGLHASSLSFPHPVTGSECRYESPLPALLGHLF
jgi:23S rRNA pseudouridine1911/1915/1917 synthase